MLGHRSLKHTSMYSAISSHSTLNPQAGRKKRRSEAGLILTSLVDAFSILVIFLMMNNGNPQAEVKMSKDLTLPASKQSQPVTQTTTIRIERGHYFVNEQEVRVDQIGEMLKTIKVELEQKGSSEKESLTILADKEMDFATLNPLVLGASQAGFSEFKFAVMPQPDQASNNR